MNKYKAKKEKVDGIWFDSKAEARRYGTLAMLERAGKIADLRLQPPFQCEVNGKLICTYKADFSYVENGQTVIEDVKGVRTQMFSLKRKLVEALHGVEIKIIPA